MGRKNLIATAALVLASTGASSAWANLLLAPGFENPGAPSAATADQLIPGSIAPSVPTQQNPWFYGRSAAGATGSNAYYSSTLPTASGGPAANRINTVPTGGTAQSFAAADGTQYAYGYTVGQSQGQSTYIAQAVTGASIVPGTTYLASASFFMRNNATGTGADGDRLQGGSYDSLQLVFLDAAGLIISSAQSTARVDGTTPANTWTPISFTAVAPAGTASIVFENLLTRGTAGGVMFVDSASLDATTPEPASLALLATGGLALLRRRRA